jgi:glycerate dehydrogenase
VNTARAELVDNQALAVLVARGAIRGVGLDVFDSEPPDATGIVLDRRVVVSPHVAFATREAASELYRVALAVITVFAAGTPQNVVGC